MPDSPHLRTPFSLSGGSLATVEQGSAEEIEQCVEACCKTLIGSRIDAPEYGVPDETFRTEGALPSVADVLAAVEAAEPRAALLGSATVEDMVKRIVLKLRVAA